MKLVNPVRKSKGNSTGRKFPAFTPGAGFSNGVKIVFLGTAALLVMSSGCATLKKKLSPSPRRSQPEERRTARKGGKEWWYKNHYLWWRSWAGEAAEYLGRNNKRATKAAEEALANLKKMEGALIEEKSRELSPYVAELSGIVEEITRDRLTDEKVDRLKTMLIFHQRRVEKSFSFKKVYPWIKRGE